MESACTAAHRPREAPPVNRLPAATGSGVSGVATPLPYYIAFGFFYGGGNTGVVWPAAGYN